MRVLVVGEDAVERTRATAALRARPDVEILEATTAQKAHALVLEEDFDVLIIDGDMRPEGGYSLLYEIRSAAQFHDAVAPPAIVLMDREQDRWLSRWAGAAQAVRKPVDSFDVARRAQELFDETGGAVEVDTAGVSAGRELASDGLPPEFEGADAEG